MSKRRYRIKTPQEIDHALRLAARAQVEWMIENAHMTYDMRIRAKTLQSTFYDYMLADMRIFEETGKYPKYVAPLVGDSNPLKGGR